MDAPLTSIALGARRGVRRARGSLLSGAFVAKGRLLAERERGLVSLALGLYETMRSVCAAALARRVLDAIDRSIAVARHWAGRGENLGSPRGPAPVNQCSSLRIGRAVYESRNRSR